MPDLRTALLKVTLGMAALGFVPAQAEIPPVPQAFDITFDDAKIRKDPKLGDAKWKQKAPDDGTGHPKYIQDMRHYLREALTAYELQGFDLPALPIKVHDAPPELKDRGQTIRGVIYIRRERSSGQLKHTAAHEVFHAIQYVTLGPAFAQKIGGDWYEWFYGKPIEWWQEASAEYASCYLAGSVPTKGQLCMGHGDADPGLLSTPLNTANGALAYDWGHFIKFIAAKDHGGTGADDIKSLMAAIAKDLAEAWGTEDGVKAIDAYLRTRSGNPDMGIAFWYRRFAGFYLLGKDRPHASTRTPDDLFTDRQTFTVAHDETAETLTLIPTLGGASTGVRYLTAGTAAVEFDFPDEEPRFLTVELKQPEAAIAVDLYIRKKDPDPRDPAFTYILPEGDPIPDASLDANNTRTGVKASSDEVLFVVATCGDADHGSAWLELRHESFEACMASPTASDLNDDSRKDVVCLDFGVPHFYLGNWTCCGHLQELERAQTPLPANEHRPAAAQRPLAPATPAKPAPPTASDVNKILKGW